MGTVPKMVLRSVPSNVHRLKISLAGSKPPIWRRVEVSSDTTLADLHEVIQTAMGWWDCHLHAFEIDDRRYGPDADDDWGPPVLDEAKARLTTVAKEGETFLYTYDFGDGWEHKITVEQTAGPTADASYPRCLTGRRAGPPEDCGGIWGYEDMLRILSDPTDAEYEERLEWLGGEFDPEAFDLDAVNEALEMFAAATSDRG